jgi:uncharacterized protein
MCVSNDEREDLSAILKGNQGSESSVLEKLVSGDFVRKASYDPYKMLELVYDDYNHCNGTLTVIVILSEACNFRCKYCYEGYDGKVMESDTIDGIINFVKNYISNNYCKKIVISWFGGEPTLFKTEIVAFMKKLRTSIADSVEVSGFMTTNAYLLTIEDFKAYCEVGINGYQITVDGFEDTHDKLRQLASGDGTWSKIIENLHAIADISSPNLYVLLRVNYNEDVMVRIFEFFDYIKSEFGDRFVIHAHPISKLGKDENDSVCNKEIETNE